MAESQPREAQELVFKIRNRQILQDLVNDLRTAYLEMRDCNPNMHPIQLHTKIRWQNQVGLTLEFLEKLLPTSSGTKEN